MLYSTISSSQKQFVSSSILNNIRIDGRKNTEYPHFSIQTHILDHLLGSALLKIKSLENQLAIYTGIKFKISKTNNIKQNVNQLNLEPKNKQNQQNILNRINLQVGCIKKLTQQQQVIRLYLQQNLNKYIVYNYLSEFQKLLAIKQAKSHSLSINIEVYLLNIPHISYLEYLFICAKTAIRSSKLPQFIVTYNQVIDQQTVETKVSYNNNNNNNTNNTNNNTYKGLDNIKMIGIIQQTCIMGMTVQQYDSVDSCILVTYNQQNKINSFQTVKGKVKIQNIHKILKFSTSK